MSIFDDPDAPFFGSSYRTSPARQVPDLTAPITTGTIKPGCTCLSPETDWSPDLACGGISETRYENGRLVERKEPPLCEVHMKKWGHRRGCPVHTNRGSDV